MRRLNAASKAARSGLGCSDPCQPNWQDLEVVLFMTGQTKYSRQSTQLGLLFFAAICSLTAIAEEATAPPPESDLWTRKFFLGDWDGGRQTLADNGLSFRLNYTQFGYVNISGGRDTENGHDLAGSYDFTILAQFDKMQGLENNPFFEDLDFFIRARGRWGGNPGDFDGDKVGALHRTNFEVASPNEEIFVDRWWFRKRMLDNRLEFRIGKLTAVVDDSDYAGSAVTQFANRALADNPIIPGDFSPGIAVKLWLQDWLFVSGAVMDDELHPRTLSFQTPFQSPAEFRVLWEIGALPTFESENGPLPGNYRIGSFFVPRDRRVFFDDLGGRLAPRTRDDDVGLFLGFDQLVWRETPGAKDKQGLALFGKYGYSHADINFLEHYWAAGGQYQGLIPGRDDDVLGFGVAQSIVSGDYRREIDGTFDRETVYELYYRIKLAPWLWLTPDIQFINQPGANQDDRDAFVAGLRLRVTF